MSRAVDEIANAAGRELLFRQRGCSARQHGRRVVCTGGGDDADGEERHADRERAAASWHRRVLRGVRRDRFANRLFAGAIAARRTPN
jgi:hypothetical protein